MSTINKYTKLVKANRLNEQDTSAAFNIIMDGKSKLDDLIYDLALSWVYGTIIKDKSNGIILTKPYINNLKTEVENLIQNKEALLKYHEEANKTLIPTKEEEFNIIMKLYDNYYNMKNLRNWILVFNVNIEDYF